MSDGPEAQAGCTLEDEPELRLGCSKELPRTDEEGHPVPSPVLDIEAQGGVCLGRRIGSDTHDVPIAVVLAPNVMRGISFDDRAEERDLRVFDRLRVAAGR